MNEIEHIRRIFILYFCHLLDTLFYHRAASHTACKYVVKLDVCMKDNLATTQDVVIEK